MHWMYVDEFFLKILIAHIPLLLLPLGYYS